VVYTTSTPNSAPALGCAPRPAESFAMPVSPALPPCLPPPAACQH
jgi:hypothetical protein